MKEEKDGERCIGRQKEEDEGRTGGGEGALLRIDRGEDQPVNSDFILFENI